MVPIGPEQSIVEWPAVRRISSKLKARMAREAERAKYHAAPQQSASDDILLAYLVELDPSLKSGA